MNMATPRDHRPLTGIAARLMTSDALRVAVNPQGQFGYPVAIPVHVVKVSSSLPLKVAANGLNGSAAVAKVTATFRERGFETLPAPDPNPSGLPGSWLMVATTAASF